MKPDPSLVYLCFTLSHDEGEAVASYKARFGKPPEFIFEDLQLLRVGPIPED